MVVMYLYRYGNKVFQFYDNPVTGINISQYQIIMSNYYLMASSMGFLGPALYGAYKGQKILPAVSLIHSIISISHWQQPYCNKRLILDLAVSKTVGVIYFIYGYSSIQGNLRVIGYTNLLCLLSAYQSSCYLYSMNNSFWLWSHMIFHGFTTFGQFLVVITQPSILS
jgi:hypothetical protein